MARCPTCHRRLVSGQSCPAHGGAAAIEQAVAPVSPSPPIVRVPPIDRVMDTALGQRIGAGGFASVWALGDDRVVKVAHASHALATARMAREAEALAAIGAPAVPRLHGTGALPDGRAWLVMDRVSGTTLADITTAGPQRPSDAVAMALGILDALTAIHAARFVHRDIKPDNLVRTPDGRIVVLDLGLARKLPDDPDDPTRADVQVGSLEYMAPEQIENSAAVDERSDLYAFGCVLYELCAGRPPFVGDAAALERAHAALRPPRLGGLVTVPAAVEALCHDCLAKEPARRPATAGDARARLATAHDEPAMRSGTQQISMIRESKQPVVVLWVELPRVDRALLSMFASRRLVVVSQRGRKVVAGAVGGDHGDPATIAIAVARDLAAAGARVALHLDAVRVESVAGAVTLKGEPVEKPETWLPTATWTGVVLTRQIASVVQAPMIESSAGSEFRALGDDQQRRELFGRDALLTDLVADAAAALLGTAPMLAPVDGIAMPRTITRSGSKLRRITGPAFALLVGDAGVGKTAFATELARRLVELDVAVHFATIPTPGTAKPHSALSSLIGTRSIGSIVRDVGDALRAAARHRPLAVILDDLQLGDHDLFDALEYATLGGEPLPLWVIGIAAPRLEVHRPRLGARAERYRRDLLLPLDEDASVALAASLLRPAEYPPLRALRRLAGIARGNPLHLATLVREIHERGAIRARAGGAHFLDTSALDELTPAALGPWLAARELSGLAVELVALARICAVLGGGAEIGRDELVAIVEAVERGGGATTTIDVDVGLAELEAAGVLVESVRGYRFRQALVEEGVYATTDESERLALHRAALDHWRLRAGTTDVADHIARHAEAVGDHADSARAFATLGGHALATNALFEADQAWSGALRHLDARDVRRARALLGRGQARYRLQRIREALVDLDEAVAIGAELADPALETEALLVKAIALDFLDGMSGDFTGTNAVLDEARAKFGGVTDAVLAIDLDLAEARKLYREQRFADAIPALRVVLERARASNRYEAETIAGLLLGASLSDQRIVDEAERVFADLIDLCRTRDDRFHLAAAYVNRTWLWVARGDLDRTEQDLEQVIQLSREGGIAVLERAGTHNLAEHRLWLGQLDPALQLARRGLSLQVRSGEGATHPDRLLLGRVLGARHDVVQLDDVLATFDSDAGVTGEELVVLAILRAVAADDRDALARAAAQLDVVSFLQLRLELGLLARAVLDDNQRDRLREAASTDPIFSTRISEFG